MMIRWPAILTILVCVVLLLTVQQVFAARTGPKASTEPPRESWRPWFATIPVESAHKKSYTKCSSGHARIVAADSQAQVFEAPAIASLPEYLDFIGCVYGQRRSYVLGIPPSYGSPTGTAGSGMYTLTGTIVAFEESSTTNLQPGIRFVEEIVVRNLLNGRILHKVPTGTPATPSKDGDVGIGGATAIVVKSDGAVAWIVAVSGKAVAYQVHAVDKTGSRVLASGPEISPSSLALAGSTLYWTQGGKPMSATLN
jgi:hypothetical protein